jgi:thiol-disulfide isomerase/thioredoxin
VKKLATVFAFLALLALLPLGPARAQEDDEPSEIELQTMVEKLKRNLKKKNFEAAEEIVSAARQKYPQNPQVASLGISLAFAESRAKRHDQALSLATAYVDFALAQLDKEGADAGNLPGALESFQSIATKAEQPEVLAKKLDQAIVAVEARNKKEAAVDLADALSQLQGLKVLHLAEQKETDRATALMSELLNSARRAQRLDEEDIGAILALANLLNTHGDLLEKTSPDKEAAARQKFREFVAAQAKEHAGRVEIVSLYLNAKMSEFYDIVQADPKAGEKLRADLEGFLEHLVETHPKLKRLAARGEQLLEAMQQQIESSQAHQEMIGKPAVKLEVSAWVNGEPLSEKDLAGKVVLLDFWAVWCGPCIATFPHLREWQEKYAGKGLVIIGMTNYYQYGWNEAAQASEHEDELGPEEEREALVKFATHHKLKHRFGLMDEDSEFPKEYGVQGIPQLVLIDRSGKVRMIRVGSGSKNAHDFEEAIKQALAMPAPAAG